MSENYGIDTGAIIVHMPHDVTVTRKIANKKDVTEYIIDTSGKIVYGTKRERIQQATNLKNIIFWLMNEMTLMEDNN